MKDTEVWIERFESEIIKLKAATDIDSDLRDLFIEALESQLLDLKAER